jgi:hypothetical protein
VPDSSVRSFSCVDGRPAAPTCACCKGGLPISSCTVLSRSSDIACAASCVLRRVSVDGLSGLVPHVGPVWGRAVSGVRGCDPARGLAVAGGGVGFRRAGSLSMVWGTSAWLCVCSMRAGRYGRNRLNAALARGAICASQRCVCLGFVRISVRSGAKQSGGNPVTCGLWVAHDG